MSKTNFLTKQTWKYHVAFWILYISANHFLRIVEYNWQLEYIYISDTLIKYTLSIGIFYLNLFYLLPLLFKKKKYLFFIFFQSGVLLGNGIVRFGLIKYVILPLGLIPGYDYGVSSTTIISTWWWLHYTLYALGYYYFKEAIKREKGLRLIEQHNSKLKEEQSLAEQRRLQSDYAFLRAQISPHFLHNTLSYFYSRSLNGHSEELSEAILTLSDIMRYALEKRESSMDKILLEEEIDHIGNVIKINGLRFSNTFNLNFEVKGNIRGIYIIPLILITLVENVFKHGELTDFEYPVNISLEVSDNKNELVFSTQNKKKKGPVELSGGIGMENTRHRLDMIYGENYKLDIEENSDFYKAILCINLKESYKVTDQH